MRDQAGIPDFAGGGCLCTGWARAWLALGAAFILMANAFAQDPIPGSLHTSPFPGFASGSGKIANLDIGANSNDYVRAIAVQPDGKIVMAGNCTNGVNYDFCLARLNADGSLDTSFDGPSGTANGKFLLPIGPNDDSVYAMAVQPDGKIVVGGVCGSELTYDFCLARFNGDGSLDASFDGPDGNGNGKFLLPIGPFDDYARALVLQPDGKILITGLCVNDIGSAVFCIARLNANGSLDPTFDGPSGTGNGKFLVSLVISHSPYALALQADGKILMAGACYDGVVAAKNNFCVFRLNVDGSLDVAFDGPGVPGNGKFMFPVGTGYDAVSALAVQPDGKLVLAGFCGNGAVWAFCLARLNVDGSLDTSFDGPAGTGNGKFILPQMGAGSESANALSLQPDGKIVIAGNCSNGVNDDFCIVRLNADGSFDASFAGPSGTANGRFLLPIGSSVDVAYALALQPDGKILIAGYCYSGTSDDFCIARLNGGPYAAKNCSMDVDGDGAMIATRDGLMITRVMLGLTGSAVTSGVTFAAHATRTSWADIRNYLVGQCGMTIAP